MTRAAMADGKERAKPRGEVRIGVVVTTVRSHLSAPLDCILFARPCNASDTLPYLDLVVVHIPVAHSTLLCLS